MEEENYIRLKSQLQNIRYKLTELDDCYIELKSFLKKNYLVNDKMIEADFLSTIGEQQEKVKNEIDTILIPRINQNIRR